MMEMNGYDGMDGNDGNGNGWNKWVWIDRMEMNGNEMMVMVMECME